MTKLKDSFYLRTYLSSNYSDFGGAKELEDQIRSSPLEFARDKVDYATFIQPEHYNDNDWLGRKITAIPKTLFTGVIFTTIHLAMGLFISPLYALVDREGAGKYFKAMMFNVVRDLQKTFGHITCLFHDAYGLYHIQEANFYLTSYALSLEVSKKMAKSSPTRAAQENQARERVEDRFAGNPEYAALAAQLERGMERDRETKREARESYEIYKREHEERSNVLKQAYKEEKKAYEEKIFAAQNKVIEAQKAFNALPLDATLAEKTRLKIHIVHAQRNLENIVKKMGMDKHAYHAEAKMRQDSFKTRTALYEAFR